MPAVIQIGFEGDSEQLDTLLKAYQAVVNDATPFLELAGNEAIKITARKFARQGPGWAPLAERTKLNRKNKDKGSIKILQDRGILRNSIVSAESGAEGSVYKLTQRELLIGSNLVYAAIHQFGWNKSQNPPPKIPARPYLPTREELIPVLERKLGRLLKETVS